MKGALRNIESESEEEESSEEEEETVEQKSHSRLEPLY